MGEVEDEGRVEGVWRDVGVVDGRVTGDCVATVVVCIRYGC